jgi:hypothetical protein
MPNSSFSNRWQGQRNRPSCFTSPLPELYQAGYQQALADYDLPQLLHVLQNFSDDHFDAALAALTPSEVEILATVLIQGLTTAIKGSLLADYLSAIRRVAYEEVKPLSQLHLSPPAIDLPTDFPVNAEMPKFLYGDRLCWLSQGEITDWGIVIGRFYSFAPHRCCWCWCYLIWLDPDSPSFAWVRADIAWEDDLEPLEMESNL